MRLLQVLVFFIGLGFLSDTRAVYLLVEDSLDSEKPLYPFLLINPCKLCEEYHEKLYDYKGARRVQKDALLRRLRCHRDSSSGNNYRSFYYVKSEEKGRCKALNVKDGKVYVVKCDEGYPSLCTNSGVKRHAHTTPSNRTELLYSVNTTFGRLTGTRTDVAFTFLGIPYALPPVGNLRFEDPVRISKLRDNWDASYYRSHCPQGNEIVSSPVINEDCLYLNVFTPYIPDDGDCDRQLLPVMVWIHGGAFFRGAQQKAYNDPSHLVSHENVVVVSINYRLGALGFWACGNQGIKDQVVALQWVREHISSFGGDPSKVTVAGESAGAASVRTFMSIKAKTQGLFRAAIMLSDPISLSFVSKNESIFILSEMMASSVGCIKDQGTINDPGVMDCMRKMPVETLIKHQPRVMATSFLFASTFVIGLTYGPCMDGDLIKENFYDSIEDGNFVQVPTMIGFVRDEGAYFMSEIYSSPVPNSYANTTLSYYFNRKQIAQIMSNKLYSRRIFNSSDPDRVRIFLSEVFSDAIWKCPTQLAAAKMSKYTDVYLYYYNYSSLWAHSLGSLCYGRVCHGDEIPAFIGSIAIPGIQSTYESNGTVTQPDLVHSRLVISRVGSFLKTLNPNPNVDKLCYDKEYFKVGDCNRRTVKWKTFTPNTSLEDAPSFSNRTFNGKVYGPLHVLNLTEAKSGNHIVPREICDFWYKLGIHAQLHSPKNKPSSNEV